MERERDAGAWSAVGRSPPSNNRRPRVYHTSGLVPIDPFHFSFFRPLFLVHLFVRIRLYMPTFRRSTPIFDRAIRTRHTYARVQWRGLLSLVRPLINVQWLIDAPSVFVSNPDSGLLPRSNRAIFIALRIALLGALATPILPIPLILPPLFSSSLSFILPRRSNLVLPISSRASSPPSTAVLFLAFYSIKRFVYSLSLQKKNKNEGETMKQNLKTLVDQLLDVDRKVCRRIWRETINVTRVFEL